MANPPVNYIITFVAKGQVWQGDLLMPQLGHTCIRDYRGTYVALEETQDGGDVRAVHLADSNQLIMEIAIKSAPTKKIQTQVPIKLRIKSS